MKDLSDVSIVTKNGIELFHLELKKIKSEEKKFAIDEKSTILSDLHETWWK